MKTIKKALIFIMCLVLAASSIIGTAATASAANYTSNYSKYDEPENSGDYAYWNGKKVVKSSSTTKEEIQWMQAAINYCIKNKGLNVKNLLDVDGSFGPASKEATIKFQKKYGLDADGSFGPSTIKKMKKVLKESNPTPQPTPSDGKMVSPLKNRKIISNFQPYYRQDAKTSRAHSGIDYKGDSKTIYCFYNGTVSATGYNASTGNYIEIKHSNKGTTFYSYYFHLKNNSIKVKKGNNVTAGAAIATMGSTGQSSGDHLHFQITSKSVINSNGSFHCLPQNNAYKNWSISKQAKIVSVKSSRGIVFYNPEIVLTQGISVITG